MLYSFVVIFFVNSFFWLQVNFVHESVVLPKEYSFLDFTKCNIFLYDNTAPKCESELKKPCLSNFEMSLIHSSVAQNRSPNFKVTQSNYHHRQVLLKSFNLNSQTLGFLLQTQPLCKQDEKHHRKVLVLKIFHCYQS